MECCEGAHSTKESRQAQVASSAFTSSLPFDALVMEHGPWNMFQSNLVSQA